MFKEMSWIPSLFFDLIQLDEASATVVHSLTFSLIHPLWPFFWRIKHDSKTFLCSTQLLVNIIYHFSRHKRVLFSKYTGTQASEFGPPQNLRFLRRGSLGVGKILVDRCKGQFWGDLSWSIRGETEVER